MQLIWAMCNMQSIWNRHILDIFTVLQHNFWQMLDDHQNNFGLWVDYVKKEVTRIDDIYRFLSCRVSLKACEGCCNTVLAITVLLLIKRYAKPYGLQTFRFSK